ncbi:thyroid transcription factor 1-associated protein 26-like [Crassostrea angulata]|uniref:thyroid transcription factor 1-associated protein 26-like n=1 Tax=Magallana angulata TaxID=2784310 RepID=UPI0022B0CD29|nr:thyroid transcription factor 1-associated protein 26-like [Crassostrea angulata]
MDNQKRVERKLKEKNYKKFTGNKEEGQGFADRRKRKIEHEYRKMLKKEKKASAGNAKHISVLDELSEEEATSAGPTESKQRSSHKPVGTYSKAHHEYKQTKMEKDRKKKEARKRKQAVDTALEKYQQKRQANYKLLCKRTSRGQPIMKHQMEYLLEKIKKQKSSKT